MDMVNAHSLQLMDVVNQLNQVQHINKTPYPINICSIYTDNSSKELMVEFNYILKPKPFVEKACHFITSSLIHFTPARQLIILGEEFREYTLSNQVVNSRTGTAHIGFKRVFYQSH